MKNISLIITTFCILCGCTANNPDVEKDDSDVEKIVTYSCVVSDDGIIYNNENFTINLLSDSDYSKVLSADFYIDGELLESIFSEPYSYTGSIADLPVGEHTANIIITQNNNSSAKAESKFTFLVKLGDEYQGGVIIHLSENGMSGIIASKEDIPGGRSGRFQWGYKYEGYDAYSETDGYSNTQKFTGRNDDNFAAIACLNYREGGYDDWYLPSVEEFEYLKDFEEELIPSRLENIYWTSTQIDETHAEIRHFGRAGISSNDKIVFGNYHYVRAVRRF